MDFFSLFILNFFLTPILAFTLYFCFLHSIRHSIKLIFELDKSIPLEQKKTFASAASSALSDKLQLLAEKLYRGNDTEIDVSDQGEFRWRDSIIGTCEKGSDIFRIVGERDRKYEAFVSFCYSNVQQ